ncbi:MAG: hypothetical protein Q9174_003007 [Haloplaca sp. 1 TL-2023]
MNISQPMRRLFAKAPQAPHRTSRRAFRASTCLYDRPAPKHKSIKAADLGLIAPHGGPKRVTAKDLPSYSESEMATLSKRYTPEQIAAIEAGEAAVDPTDLAEQGALREDPMRLSYIDDFSSIHPVVDKPIRAPEGNYDPNLRFKDEDELEEDMVDWIKDMPDNPSRLDWMKFMDKTRLTVGNEAAERNPRSSLAPDIPKLKILKSKSLEDEDIDPPTRRLMRQTGFTFKEVKKFRIKNLVAHRVVNQTRLGKIQSMYYLTVAGNGRGLIGIGEGKSAESDEAKTQAKNAAIRNMQPISMYEGRTIYGDVKGKVSATEVELMTRPPGFGLRCQSLIFEICRCAGLSDMAARVTRSRNHMNTVKATLQALLSQRLPEEIARARGRKLVDVRKVYYGGNI